MSRLQEKDSSLFSDLANTTIAGQLESRLRELERNIAVARQFIKLADECYTQVKHEWELLQQDTRFSKAETEAQYHETHSEKKEDNIQKTPFKFKAKKTRSSNDSKREDLESQPTHTPSIGSKSETSTPTETSSSKHGKHSDKSFKTPKNSKNNRKESSLKE